MKTLEDIRNMANADYSIGLEAHYKPLAQLVSERGYKHIVEVGTAYGGNAFHLLAMTDISSLRCIDPYIYYPAMPGFTCQEEYDMLYEFASWRLSTFPQARIIRKTSKEAIERLWLSDLIFLDGSHEYEDVKWECNNYLHAVRSGGVLSGHDYNIFEGVNKAVDEFAKQINKPVQQLHGNIWYFNL